MQIKQQNMYRPKHSDSLGLSSLKPTNGPTCPKESYQKSFQVHDADRTTADSICEICGESYKNESYLYYHHRNFHKELRCKMCGKKFVGRNALLKHERNTHATNQDHVCDQCGKGFKLRGYLVNHKLSHHPTAKDNDDMKCKFCGKTFHKKDKLRLHENSVHIGKKAYACRADMCRMAFTTPSVRKNHERVVHDLDIQLPRGRKPKSRCNAV